MTTSIPYASLPFRHGRPHAANHSSSSTVDPRCHIAHFAVRVLGTYVSDEPTVNPLSLPQVSHRALHAHRCLRGQGHAQSHRHIQTARQPPPTTRSTRRRRHRITRQPAPQRTSHHPPSAPHHTHTIRPCSAAARDRARLLRYLLGAERLRPPAATAHTCRPPP